MTTVFGQKLRKTQAVSHHFQSVRGGWAQILSLLPSMKEPLHIDGSASGRSARVEQDPLQELSVKNGCETRLQTGIVHEGRKEPRLWLVWTTPPSRARSFNRQRNTFKLARNEPDLHGRTCHVRRRTSSAAPCPTEPRAQTPGKCRRRNNLAN